MLPAWATVTIALGGSVITATLALLGALATSRRQDVVQWRALLVSAADEFATGTSQALRAMREAIVAFNDRPPQLFGTKDELGIPRVVIDRDSVHPRSVWLTVEAVAVADDRLARVLLLFGQESPAGQAGQNVIASLREAVAHLRAYLDEFEKKQRQTAFTGGVGCRRSCLFKRG